MWVIIEPYLLQYGVPLALAILQKTGLVTQADAALVKVGTHVLTAVEGTKFSQSYPEEVHSGGV